MTTIEERVEAGARWLDANRPGWVDRINLETLNLGDPCNCVLGQEFDTFHEGADVVRGPDYYDDPDYPVDRDPIKEIGFEHDLSFPDFGHSFDVRARADYYGARDAQYTALTDTWRDYIVERRATVLPHGGQHCSCVIPCETCGADMLTTGYLAGCEECSERRQCAYDRAEFGDQLAPGGAS